MQKQLSIHNQNISYSVRLSRRARRARISVACDSSVVVTLPLGFKEGLADNFVREKFEWIIKSLKKFAGRSFVKRTVIKSGKKEYLKHKQAAVALAKNKVVQWNNFYGFKYNKVSVKNQKTRWGSCSKKGNLNFNYKIVHLPENLVDYLVVHELCHLMQMNHGRNFWQLVAEAIPDYKNLRQELRNFRVNLS